MKKLQVIGIMLFLYTRVRDSLFTDHWLYQLHETVITTSYILFPRLMRHNLARYGLQTHLNHPSWRHNFCDGHHKERKQGSSPTQSPARDRRTVSRYASSHDFECFDLSGLRTKMTSWWWFSIAYNFNFVFGREEVRWEYVNELSRTRVVNHIRYLQIS